LAVNKPDQALDPLRLVRISTIYQNLCERSFGKHALHPEQTTLLDATQLVSAVLRRPQIPNQHVGDWATVASNGREHHTIVLPLRGASETWISSWHPSAHVLVKTRHTSSKRARREL
jgi:hypothetical protein